MDTRIERLIELHSVKAYGIALRMAGNPADAADLVQEAFLRVMKYSSAYDPDRPFEAWLQQIIRNIYIDSLRLEARRRQVPLAGKIAEDSLSLEETLPDPSPGPERLVETAFQAEEIQTILNALSPALRMAVVLVDLEGHEREEAARVLGCSLSALDVRLHRARAALGRALKNRQA